MADAYVVHIGSALNLRSGPSPAAPILASLPSGTRVTRLDDGDSAGFWHISAAIADELVEGWAASLYLVPDDSANEEESLIDAFSWTIQYSPKPRQGRIVEAASGTELRYLGIDQQLRRIPVDLGYEPPDLAAVPPELHHLQAVTTEVGWAARALLGWMLHGQKPYGTVVPFDVADRPGEPPRHYAGRLERHGNALYGVSVYAFEAA